MKLLDKEMNIPSLVIAGTTSGVGKTSITSAIILESRNVATVYSRSRLGPIILIPAIFPRSQRMMRRTWTFG